MRFSSIEAQAQNVARGQKTSCADLGAAEHLCLFCLTNLYRRFYSGEINRETAKPIKSEIRADYELLERERSLWKAAYAQFQESIRLASGEREQLPILARSGSWEAVARSALRILSAMTGEGITEKAVLKQLEVDKNE